MIISREIRNYWTIYFTKTTKDKTKTTLWEVSVSLWGPAPSPPVFHRPRGPRSLTLKPVGCLKKAEINICIHIWQHCECLKHKILFQQGYWKKQQNYQPIKVLVFEILSNSEKKKYSHKKQNKLTNQIKQNNNNKKTTKNINLVGCLKPHTPLHPNKTVNPLKFRKSTS